MDCLALGIVFVNIDCGFWGLGLGLGLGFLGGWVDFVLTFLMFQRTLVEQNLLLSNMSMKRDFSGSMVSRKGSLAWKP